MARVRIDAELGADDDALAALLGGEEGPRRTVEPVAIAGSPSSFARTTSSSGREAPRKNVNAERARSSTKCATGI